MMDINSIVADYIANKRRDANREISWYSSRKPLAGAIREAALSRLPSKKRHPHQRRISGKVLEIAESRLQAAAGKLQQTKNFDDLHHLIENEIGSIPGIGPLAVYDIAHRIGAYLKYEPTQVYLHAGTAIGAKALGFEGKTINPSSLPQAFRQLTPAEIEDCLCMYKKHFRQRAGE